MRKQVKALKAGDLVLISTPSFHIRQLDDNLEGKTGVIMRVVDAVLPTEHYASSGRPTYDVLVEGKIIVFYNDRYMSRVRSR